VARGPGVVGALLAVAAAALVTRTAPYLLPGQITAVREYDDGVMLGGAMALLSGQIPYVDFVYLHPPASLLILLPSASAAALLGEPGAMAVARVVAVLMGVANTVLIAGLLSNRGWTAVLVGGGLYASWPVVVSTERTILLEPVLVLGLLIALLLVRRRTPLAVVAAAVTLGVATTVKVWAVADIVIVAAMVAATMGRGMLLRFVAAASLTVTIICLPFFLRGPAAMSSQVVTAQLVRAGTPASVDTRVSTMSLASGVHALDAVIPWPVWLGVLLFLIAMGLLPLVSDLRKRTGLASLSEASWWAVIMLAHSLIILLSSGYFYHYAAWMLAPLCLTVGYSCGTVVRRVSRWVLVAAIAAVFVMSAFGALRHPGEPLQRGADLAGWASTHDCTWSESSRLIAANSLRRNLANGCSFDIDQIGVFLALDQEVSRRTDDFGESPTWRVRQWNAITSADGVMLRGDQLPVWFTADQRAEFVRLFAKEAVVSGYSLWGRS
jgi:alpha-1,2-mannosyltransferase